MKNFKAIVAIIALFALISMDSFANEPKLGWTTCSVKVDQNGLSQDLTITKVSITVYTTLGQPTYYYETVYNDEHIVTFTIPAPLVGVIVPSCTYYTSLNNPDIEMHSQPYSGSWAPLDPPYCKIYFTD